MGSRAGTRTGTGTMLVAAAVVTVAMPLAPTAAANSDGSTDYIYDLNNSGIGGPTDQLMALGSVACTGKQNGVDRSTSVSEISKSSSLQPADAAFLYDSATIFLCP